MPMDKPFQLPEGFLFTIHSPGQAIHNQCALRRIEKGAILQQIIKTVKLYSYEKNSIYNRSIDYTGRDSGSVSSCDGKIKGIIIDPGIKTGNYFSDGFRDTFNVSFFICYHIYISCILIFISYITALSRYEFMKRFVPVINY